MRLLALCCLSLTCWLTGCASPAPSLASLEQRIIPVAEWGGTPADASRARLHTISRITLHHQGETFLRGRDPLQYLRNLQVWSRTTRGWLDIPYHYIIDLDGKLYEGRNIAYAGDTNTSYDPAGHALIEVVGNFEEVEPTPAQLDAVVTVMTMLAARYRLPVEAISGHKDFAETACPGEHLYRYLANGYFREQVRQRLAALQP